jgi:hypothetical protein
MVGSAGVTVPNLPFPELKLLYWVEEVGAGYYCDSVAAGRMGATGWAGRTADYC